jgi:peptidoglycan/xylan/chitin deacetylase (PgdA/CDA1 family)
MTVLKKIVRVGLHQFGGLHFAIWRTRTNFRILTYHRFSPQLYPNIKQSLARQCQFIKQSFNVLSLTDIALRLESGRALEPRTMAITVDDGYRDFLTDAFPIFRSYGIPATVYLITDFIDGKLWPWWDQIEYAAQRSRVASITLAALDPDNGAKVLSLHTDAQRSAAVSDICARLVKIPDQSRLAFLKRVPELFEVDIPNAAPAHYAPLSWDEIRMLAQAQIEFGGHTKTHPILPNVEDPDLLFYEIATSRARIYQELGYEPAHFCYPNGDHNSATVVAVERCGFQTAVTTQAGLNAAGAHPFLLKRLSVEPGFQDPYFREEIVGLHGRHGP